MEDLKMLTGFAVINDTVGKRVAFTYNVVTQEGKVKEQNVKKSFIVLDDETLKIIEQLEAKIKVKLNI